MWEWYQLYNLDHGPQWDLYCEGAGRKCVCSAAACCEWSCSHTRWVSSRRTWGDGPLRWTFWVSFSLFKLFNLTKLTSGVQAWRDVSLQSDAALALSARVVTNRCETRVKRIREWNPRSRPSAGLWADHLSITYRSLLTAPVLEEGVRPVTSVKVPEQHAKNTPASKCNKKCVKVWKYNLLIIFNVFTRCS